MRKLILLCVSLCSMALLFAASPVRAQSVLWVASNGSDANVCSQLSPCASFQGAINKGGVGEVRCLTNGNYGVISSITASLTIDCGTGNVGTVSVTGVGNSAITIDTSSAATVVLRHLSLNGNNSAGVGIFTNPLASGELVIEDCTIQGFTDGGAGGAGILFNLTAGRGSLLVSNTRIFNNGGGIAIQPTTNQIVTLTLNRVELTGNSTDGLFLGGNGVVAGTMRDSVAEGNGELGVHAQTPQIFLTIEESSIVANLIAGIKTTSPGAVVDVAASTIGANGTGVLATSGSIISFGDNHMSANGANGNFTGTAALR